MRYAFSALVRNQMIGSTYTCGPGCECMFVTSLLGQCMIDGSEAAAKLGYGTENWLSYVSPLETWVFGSVTFVWDSDQSLLDGLNRLMFRCCCWLLRLG
jgi:hypothetical protein